MKAELTVKREDGGRIRITASLYSDLRGLGWNTVEQYCPPGKRKFYNSGPGSGFATATKEELQRARLKLWEKIKPEAI